jgi:hypothetical protein
MSVPAFTDIAKAANDVGATSSKLALYSAISGFIMKQTSQG